MGNVESQSVLHLMIYHILDKLVFLTYEKSTESKTGVGRSRVRADRGRYVAGVAEIDTIDYCSDRFRWCSSEGILTLC